MMRGFTLIEILVVMLISTLLLTGSLTMANRHSEELVWKRWFTRLDELVMRTELMAQGRASRAFLLDRELVDEYVLEVVQDPELMIRYVERRGGDEVYEEVIPEESGVLALVGDPVELRWRLPFERPKAGEWEFQRVGTSLVKSYEISLPE